MNVMDGAQIAEPCWLKCGKCHENYTVAEALPVTLGCPKCYKAPPPPVYVAPPPPYPLPVELSARGFYADTCSENGEYWANLKVNAGLYVVVYSPARHYRDRNICVDVDCDMGGYDGRCGVREGADLASLLPFIDALIAVLKS